MEGWPGEGLLSGLSQMEVGCGIANSVVREYRMEPRMKFVRCIMNVLVGVNEWRDVFSEVVQREGL